jgi:hypothetical protein
MKKKHVYFSNNFLSAFFHKVKVFWKLPALQSASFDTHKQVHCKKNDVCYVLHYPKSHDLHRSGVDTKVFKT